jgi:hypothetical protein
MPRKKRKEGNDMTDMPVGIAKVMSEDYLRKRFYEDNVMPCCGQKGYFEGPSGGLSVNIKCAHCERKFNICPQGRFIEEI